MGLIQSAQEWSHQDGGAGWVIVLPINPEKRFCMRGSLEITLGHKLEVHLGHQQKMSSHQVSLSMLHSKASQGRDKNLSVILFEVSCMVKIAQVKKINTVRRKTRIKMKLFHYTSYKVATHNFKRHQSHQHPLLLPTLNSQATLTSLH